MKIDIHNSKKRLENAIESLKREEILDENRKLIIDFVQSRRVGLYKEKISDIRAAKYISYLKQLAKIYEAKTKKKRSLLYITKRDIKEILLAVDTDPKKEEWARRDFRIIMRKFVAWMRSELGYPEDYVDGRYSPKELERLSLLLPWPIEVKDMKIPRVDKLKDREEIPTKEEVRWLRQAAAHPRDKAFLALLEEIGFRPGDILRLRIKDVELIDIGAKLYVHGKTQEGEPVVVTWSASYLRDWLEVHPFRNSKNSPLWVKLGKEEPEPLDYNSARAMLIRLVKKHNKTAPHNGLPKITRRIHLYGFRYFAQIRDELEGVPRSVQIKQRGWSPTSRMPDRYARILAKDVEEYVKKKLGLADGNGNGNGNGNGKPRICPRCREPLEEGRNFCRRCGLPLNEKARQADEALMEIVS
ncbi:MAG: hypothetical protein DRN88_03325, partial [Candidatus Hydrothermarchaeota archaeon]